MKDIFVISVYISNKSQESQLRNLVSKLKKHNQTVLLTTHSHISPDIIENCDYYYYDKDNILVPSYKTNGFWSFTSDNIKQVITPYNIFNYYNYSIAGQKLSYSGLLLAKLSGYDVAHILEYDMDFESLDEFKSNNEILKNYDCVYYSYKPPIVSKDYYTPPQIPLGFLISYNLNNYSTQEFSFNQNKLTNQITKLDGGYMAEVSTLHNLIKPKNYFVKDGQNISNLGLKLNLSETFTKNGLRNSINCVCTNPDNMESFWFVNNASQTPLSLFLIINSSLYYSLNVPTNSYNSLKIENLKSVDSIKFFDDTKLINEINFNEISKEDFIKRSIIRF